MIVFTSELFALLKVTKLACSKFCNMFPMEPEWVSVTEQ